MLESELENDELGVVTGEAAHLIPYALIAALSPLGFAATLAVMRTGRVRAFGFGVGVVLGQLFACSVLVVVGGASIPSRETAHPTFEGALELALGITLLCLAVATYFRPSSSRPSAGPGGRANELLERLGHVRALTVLFAGVLLGIGGPKRLVLTALASASISASGVTGSNEAALVVWYSALATVLVWLPVLGYLLLGTRAVTRLDRALEWLTRHRRPMTVGALLVIALVLIGDAATLL
jgi:Sap, sulfolipid-1-addressing protein